MKKTIFIALLVVISTSAASGQTTLRSGPARARLIELYTSEGCSSCPRADVWASSLRGHQRLWRDFVPVAFHVTYWDHLGWTDRLADKSYSARQRAYAAAWGTDTVYTPGWVQDGREWRGWGGEPPRAGGAVGVLEAVEQDGVVTARFSPSVDAGGYGVYAARLGFALTTDVVDGENSGRRLKHDFIATSLDTMRMRREGGVWTARMRLSAPSVRGVEDGLAVWVVGPDGRPVQAAGTVIAVTKRAGR